MKNPFSPSNSGVTKPNRNAFDLSFSNNITFNFGQLIPCMCKEVLPGDTFEIDSALGLRFMPLAFPIQTKCKAYVHFFYQRSRNLWKGFEDFIYGNSDLSHDLDNESPWIAFTDRDGRPTQSVSLLKTGSLGDYLGLPTTRFSYNSSFSLEFSKHNDNYVFQYACATDSIPKKGANLSAADLKVMVDLSLSPAANQSATFYQYPSDYTGFGFYIHSDSSLNNFGPDSVISYEIIFPSGYSFDMNNVYAGIYGSDGTQYAFASCTCDSIEITSETHKSVPATRVRFTIPNSDFKASLNRTPRLFIWSRINSSKSGEGIPYGHFNVVDSTLPDAIFTPGGNALSNENYYHISALPFRCYESIYNAFYRDSRNNPRYDGVSDLPAYNKYVTTDEGGYDFTPYCIYNRNWEYDQFTSAVSSPQQGIAPLVGISELGSVTFADENGKKYTFTTETADDADTITKVNVTEDVPNSVARSIVNVASSGISINDFRNVNAFQRWLETNIRRGLKYKDQTLARWGVEPKDVSLNMPEFIGGYSVDVDINTISNTAAGSAPLGDYAGQATAFGGSSHKISHFCDQHGFIMAIISVVPVPVYTQTLSKMFDRTDPLSYYSPEFSQIGMQAVKYKELCPLEIANSDGDYDSLNPDSVFGYQRPWHDYIYSLDEAHGLFRSDFNQFLLSRQFYNPPTLSPDFLTVSSDSLNDVFTVKQPHNILGMIRFNIVAKRPIPSVSIPSL